MEFNLPENFTEGYEWPLNIFLPGQTTGGMAAEDNRSVLVKWQREFKFAHLVMASEDTKIGKNRLEEKNIAKER